MKTLNIFILVICIAFFGCERDDICAEGTSTTPRLLIEFYDFSSQDELKVVPGLTIYGEGLVEEENGPTSSSSATILFDSNASSAALPLRIDDMVEGAETTVRFILETETDLRLDEDDTTFSNVDILELTYTPEFVYVSRACGFKSIFNDLLAEEIQEPGNGNWIIDVQTQITDSETMATNVENETIVHVRIFH